MDAIGLRASQFRSVISQFRSVIVEPALGRLGLPGGEAAIRLVLGTAVQESGLRELLQDKGPALGFFQIEPATLTDLNISFLRSRGDLDRLLRTLEASWPDPTKQLATNPLYAAAVCRLIYYRAPDPLPDPDDIYGLGKYWKKFYNSPQGAGCAVQWIANYHFFVAR